MPSTGMRRMALATKPEWFSRRPFSTSDSGYTEYDRLARAHRAASVGPPHGEVARDRILVVVEPEGLARSVGCAAVRRVLHDAEQFPAVTHRVLRGDAVAVADAGAVAVLAVQALVGNGGQRERFLESADAQSKARCGFVSQVREVEGDTAGREPGTGLRRGKGADLPLVSAGRRRRRPPDDGMEPGTHRPVDARAHSHGALVGSVVDAAEEEPGVADVFQRRLIVFRARGRERCQRKHDEHRSGESDAGPVARIVRACGRRSRGWSSSRGCPCRGRTARRACCRDRARARRDVRSRPAPG